MAIDYNLLSGMGRSAAQSHQAGLESRLITDQLAHDDATRNALAGYLDSPEEERDSRLNALVAADPKAAEDVMTIEHMRADRSQAQRQQHAQAALTELQAIQRSANPGLAFRLMAERPGEDNPLRGLMEQLHGAGAINLEDGISDEEAALITDLSITELVPIAGAQDVERADPADVRAMQLLGYDLTPEGFAKYNADKGPGATTVADQIAQLQIDQRKDELRRAREADEIAAEKRQTERAQLRVALRTGITQTATIAELTKKLEGSFLQAGMPASNWRSAAASTLAGLGGALGMDTKKLRSDIDAFYELKKNMSSQLLDLMSTGKLSTQTNALLQQFQNALASPETSPGAIMAIQANIAQALIDESDAQRIEVLDRDKVEANIEKWRSYETPAGEVTVDAPAIAQEAADTALSALDDLSELARSGSKLSREAVSSAARRIESLKGSIPQADIDRALALVDNGTEEGALAARGLVDRSIRQAQQAAASASQNARTALSEISDFTKATVDQIRSVDVDALTQDQREALAKRLDALGL